MALEQPCDDLISLYVKVNKLGVKLFEHIQFYSIVCCLQNKLAETRCYKPLPVCDERLSISSIIVVKHLPIKSYEAFTKSSLVLLANSCYTLHPHRFGRCSRRRSRASSASNGRVFCTIYDHCHDAISIAFVMPNHEVENRLGALAIEAT